MSDTATYPQSAGAAPPTTRRKIDLEKILRVVFAVFVAAGSISIIEPSPFDYLSFIVLPLWLLRGFRLNVVLMPMIFL